MRGVATVCLVALVSVAQGAPDPRFPKTLEEWTPASLINPDELGDLYEGDIEPPLPGGEWQERSGLVDEKYRWPEATVPYEIDPRFSEEEVNKVENATKEFETRTHNCIKWVKRSHEADYVNIIPHPKKCSSNLGKIGGRQRISLGPKCFEKIGIAMHEMMHTLGVIHEHSRHDRDNYITVMWQNILPARFGNYIKYAPNIADPFGVPYNYGSVMHYSAFTNSANHQMTIVTKDPNVEIGQRDGLTDEDILKLMNMYKC